MKIQLFLFFILNAALSQAQLLTNYREYHFVNDNNLALSAYAKTTENQNQKGSDPLQRTNNRNLVSQTTTDSVYMEPLSFSDARQIWLVEQKPGTCLNNGYCTIKNKASGKLLTVLGYDQNQLNVSNITLSGYRLVLQAQKRNGTDIINNQKWLFANLDDASVQNDKLNSAYKEIFRGRTEYVSLKNHLIETCKISSFSFDPVYEAVGNRLSVNPQLIQGSYAMNYFNSKFKVIPARPVSFISLRDITLFRCPSVVLTGDRDFNGNIGMELRIKLELSTDRTRVIFNCSFKAREPRHDWSSTEIAWQETVYSTPPGVKIKSIISRTDWDHLFSANLNQGSFSLIQCEFLKYCEVVGDTMGDDISNDNNCNDDTRLGNFIFSKLAVILE